MYMPSTGTPVNNGMHLHPLLFILQYINHKNRINTDIVELNTCIGTEFEKEITLNNVKRIIESLKTTL